MALVPYPGLVGPTYQSQSRIASSEYCLNWYPEPLASPYAKPKSPAMALYPVPGVASAPFASSPLAPCRGALEQDGRCFFVIGYGFYELSSAGVLTLIGAVANDSHPALMCSSGDGGVQLLIVSGGSAYVFNLVSSAFALVAGPWAKANFCGFLEGRFLILDTTTSTLWISNLYDGLTWNALMFRQRSLASDRWVSMCVTRTNIWLVGSQSYEVWFPSGASPIPFDPIPGALFPVGIHAPYSISKLGDMVAWLSGSTDGCGEVVLGVQYQTTTLSDFGISFRIQQAKRDGADLTDAESMVYQEDGHNFYNLTFKNGDFTITYDLTVKMWHDRGFWDSVNGVLTAWRPLYHAFAFGYHLVGDRSTGNIYKMGIDQYTDVGGAEIRRVRRAPHLDSSMMTVFYNQLRLDIQKGVGLTSGQGSDPKIVLSYSDDGGATWGNGIARSIGKIGEYRKDVWWNALGSSRDRVFELWMSDPVASRIIGAQIDAEVGTF